MLHLVQKSGLVIFQLYLFAEYFDTKYMPANESLMRGYKTCGARVCIDFFLMLNF